MTSSFLMTAYIYFDSVYCMRQAYSLWVKDTPRNLMRVKIHVENKSYFHDKWKYVCYLASAWTRVCEDILQHHVDASYRHTLNSDMCPVPADRCLLRTVQQKKQELEHHGLCYLYVSGQCQWSAEWQSQSRWWVFVLVWNYYVSWITSRNIYSLCEAVVITDK